MFFLFLLPEIVNNDVKNNVDAGADNEEEKPQIYYLSIKSTFNCLTFLRPNFSTYLSVRSLWQISSENRHERGQHQQSCQRPHKSGDQIFVISC